MATQHIGEMVESTLKLTRVWQNSLSRSISRALRAVLPVRTCTLSFYLFFFYYSILTLKISKRLAMFLCFCCVVTYPVLVWLLTHVSCITSASCSLLFLILTSLFTSLLVAFVLKARDWESWAYVPASLTSLGKVILLLHISSVCPIPLQPWSHTHSPQQSRTPLPQGPSSRVLHPHSWHFPKGFWVNVSLIVLVLMALLSALRFL